jgi:hypothetical protein
MFTKDIDGVPDELRSIIVKMFAPIFGGESKVKEVFDQSLDTKSKYKVTPFGTYYGDAVVGCVIDPVSIMQFKIPFNKRGNLHGDAECGVTEYIFGTFHSLGVVHYDNAPIRKVNGNVSTFRSYFTRSIRTN